METKLEVLEHVECRHHLIPNPKLRSQDTSLVALGQFAIKLAPQKSYADVRRKPLEFQVGDRVMLKASHWKGVICFGKRGKLNPRYIGPFKVLAKVGAVAYKIELPQELSRVHNTFHNSRRGPEFTWEREDQFRKKYPHLFSETAPSSSAAS
ncbi:hypothetical protein Tco_1491728 [Tanacetum coccineum]